MERVMARIKRLTGRRREDYSLPAILLLNLWTALFLVAVFRALARGWLGQ